MNSVYSFRCILPLMLLLLLLAFLPLFVLFYYCFFFLLLFFLVLCYFASLQRLCACVSVAPTVVVCNVFLVGFVLGMFHFGLFCFHFLVFAVASHILRCTHLILALFIVCFMFKWCDMHAKFDYKIWFFFILHEFSNIVEVSNR